MFHIKVEGNILTIPTIVIDTSVPTLAKSLAWTEQSLLLQLKIKGFNSIFGALTITIKVKKQKFPASHNAISIAFCDSISKIHVKKAMVHKVTLVIENIV